MRGRDSVMAPVQHTAMSSGHMPAHAAWTVPVGVAVNGPDAEIPAVVR